MAFDDAARSLLIRELWEGSHNDLIQVSGPLKEEARTLKPSIRAMDGLPTAYRINTLAGLVMDPYGRVVAEGSGYGLWVRDGRGAKLRGILDASRGLIFEP